MVGASRFELPSFAKHPVRGSVPNLFPNPGIKKGFPECRKALGVGASRFELPTSRSRTVRSIRAEPRPADAYYSTVKIIRARFSRSDKHFQDPWLTGAFNGLKPLDQSINRIDHVPNLDQSRSQRTQTRRVIAAARTNQSNLIDHQFR